MPQTDWLTLARSLRIGETRKTQHCGTDRSALVSHNDRGYSLHCFRCGVPEFEAHGERSLSDILQARRSDEVLIQSEGIPSTAVACSHWPHQVNAWVLKCGLPLETANDEFGFRYDPGSRRLLIPLRGGAQAGFLGRATHGERPKWRLYGTGTFYALLNGEASEATDTVVVVEDVMSAIAVHRAGWPAVALLGTTVLPEHAQMLAVPNVVGWFDNDPAGNKAWYRLRKKMALWPTTLRRVITEKDPKHIHRAEIIARLEGTYD